MQHRSWLLLLLLIPLSMQAEINRWTAPDGSVHYSDRPQPGADRVHLPPPPTVAAPALRAAAEPAPEARYTLFRLLQPGDGATVRNNLGQVEVVFGIAPALQPGHRIHLRLNGEPWGERPYTQASRLTLNGLPRGEHVLEVTIVDADGAPVAGDRVSFYLHQASARSPVRR